MKPDFNDKNLRLPDLDHQPLWIKVAALAVAIGALVALAVLFGYRLTDG